ncbi:MAG: HlyD family efflux transporter periplasmic adaptor subunit [Chloroflexi bacterium]|nr:HlyD family efflux transporter periplasmic adaptor subunit [Chloroflexota bacterium]
MNLVKKNYWWIVGLMILTLLASGCQSMAVSLADGDQDLTASGTIRATELRIATDMGGRILNVQTQVGAEVQAGDELVVLDTTPLMLQLLQEEAAIATARADLAVAQAGARPEQIDAARAILALAEAQRDGALNGWENALSVIEEPQELDAQIIEARMQVNLAAQGVELAEAQLANEQFLRDQKDEGMERDMADLQVYAADRALAAAQADEKTAQALLNHLWRIRNEPLGFIAQANGAEGQYLVAEAGVAVAQAQLDDLLDGPTPEEIAVAEAVVRQAEAQANVLRAQMDRSTLTSPINGVVLNQAVRAGELAAPAAPILTLADLSEVTLEVYVPENRIGHVTLGQLVQVTVDSFPSTVFEGQVSGIGSEPEFTPRNVATAEKRLNTFYAVEIQLANPEGLLKPGMPADAAF